MPIWLIQIVIALALNVIAYAIAPKPKTPNATVQDLTAPTADANKPITVIFGTMTVQSTNVLWYGDKQLVTYTITATATS